MGSTDNAIERRAITRGPRARRLAGRIGPGVLLGALGILGFSFSFPATRLAVADLDPWLVAFGRATIAAVLASVYLRATRAPRPGRADLKSLAIVAAGVVVGFPLLTSLALRGETAAHGAVVIAFLPAATAVAAVLRAGERPAPRLWLPSAPRPPARPAVLAGSGRPGASGSRAPPACSPSWRSWPGAPERS